MDPEESLHAANQAFDLLCANNLVSAIDAFSADRFRDSPFHLMGLSVCAFLKAAIAMEPELVKDATRCLELFHAGAKRHTKVSRSGEPCHRFTPGIEGDVVYADAVLLLGLTYTLGESYKGYMQCLYHLNRQAFFHAHSKFTKLFRSLYPNGLDEYPTLGYIPIPTRKRLVHGVRSSAAQYPVPQEHPSGFLVRWGFVSSSPSPMTGTKDNPPNGAMEELILSGAAFGYGLFGLVLSLLPSKLRAVVGFLGYDHDRELALQALAASAARSDIHAIYSGLVLMTYHGVVLFMTGYQADKELAMRQYTAIVNKFSVRYPKGSFWILNEAKLKRLARDAEGAIGMLREALAPGGLQTFPQVDALLAFELAWTLLGLRRYEECAAAFLKLIEMNSWNIATYLFIAAGCYVSSGRLKEAQILLDRIPHSANTGRMMMPAEVLIKKKLEFYKRKQIRRGGDPDRYVEAIRISPAEEFSLFWNTHAHIDEATALAHIEELSGFTPRVGIKGRHMVARPAPSTNTKLDLDTPDELAIRSLILGIVYRTIGDYSTGRTLLDDALKHGADVEISTWVRAVAYFELAVLEMKEGDQRAARTGREAERTTLWSHTFRAAKEMLAKAAGLCTREMDLAWRLEGRVMMLGEEIQRKMNIVGV